MQDVIRIALPTPFPVGDVHAYLIADDPVTLIDTGLSYPESWEALVQGLRANGLEPRDVKRVLLTHGHLDHYGQAARLQGLGATVYMHPLETGKVLCPAWWLEARDSIVAATGASRESMEAMEAVWQSGRAMTVPLEEFVPLRAGDRFEFAHAPHLTVLELPGHSLGHVGFLRPDGVLVGGDHLLQGVSPNPIMEPLAAGGRALTLGQFFDSLTVVDGLELQRVWPGHGPAVTAHRDVVAHYRQGHARRLDAIAARIPAAGVTAFELTRELFPRVREWNIFLALSEVLAHLDYLVAHGRLQRTQADGQEYYWPMVQEEVVS